MEISVMRFFLCCAVILGAFCIGTQLIDVVFGSIGAICCLSSGDIVIMSSTQMHKNRKCKSKGKVWNLVNKKLIVGIITDC